MLHFIQNWCKNFIGSYDSLSNSDDNSLKERMTRYIKETNGKKCDCFKPHIISLKSRNVLTHYNRLTKLDDKLASIKQHNTMLERVCRLLYLKFDPRMVYAFDNEIHLVFYPNELGDYLYDGDITKTITNIVSYASICLTKEMNNEIDCVFEGNFVEFGKDYEVLNYIIWRQLDCKRNTISLLYKCVNYESILDNTVTHENVGLVELEKDVRANVPDDVLETFLYGHIFKKQIVYIETEPKSVCWREGEQLCDKESSELVTRKQMSVSHTPLWINFKSNLNKYVINKFL
jgi:hypothetical protein